MKKTSFHDVNLRYGAQMKEMFGYYLPWEYSNGHEQEHIGTRMTASLCDLGYMGIFTIEGSDSLPYMQRLFTIDCESLTNGQIRYTTMCNSEGSMMDDGTLWKIGTNNYMFISGDEGDLEWLCKNTFGFDVIVKNINIEHTTAALQGPYSKKILSKLTDADLDGIKYYHFIESKVAGIECTIARMGYTGEFGFEIHCNPQYAERIWDSIMEAGKEYGIVPCAQAALESLRQEAGYLLVGNEHNKSINPFKAGIGFVVNLKKESFNGKDALVEILKKGIDEQLVWFNLSGGEVPETGDGVFFQDKKIGVVTSGSYSYTSKAGTAMAYVNKKYAIAYAPYQIEIDGKRCDARLSIIPLYDPTDIKSKGQGVV